MGMLSNLINRMSRQPALMGGMMERLDVDLESVGREPLGLQFERAVRACALCRHGEACHAWQESGDAAAVAPDFCVNRHYFAAHRTAA